MQGFETSKKKSSKKITIFWGLKYDELNPPGFGDV